MGSSLRSIEGYSQSDAKGPVRMIEAYASGEAASAAADVATDFRRQADDVLVGVNYSASWAREAKRSSGAARLASKEKDQPVSKPVRAHAQPLRLVTRNFCALSFHPKCTP